ncbi:methyl-accepting chemotaxis protein [Aquabacterium sp. A08]|uniref:methyl-accepting chemotaxis protein n=1 Tax=Aquabacterium sp. A08 TaxID=2718532 RepID=UPI00141FB293|nr:methyl-accepting chemotaxis protein [Aquabacterium sp. A08]NIC41284.1 methyl-accepting chemotaxis protein [Aquabacterium sp. A08]NIC41296.1 methyl-accepting chemotaxis protein [Aquabacterium sp. A08]NIC42425.1 methyl-accepting chemotaxis protein [Aquabacterium sp. A08]
MRRLTLAQRLLLSSAVLLTLMTVTAVTVWVMMGKVVDAADRINQVNVPQLGLIGELELNVTRSSLQLRHAILSRDEQELNTTLQDIAAKKAMLQQTLDRFGQGMTDEAGRAAFAPLPALMNTFWQVAEQNVALIVAGQREEAFAFLVDQTIPSRNRLLAPLAAEKSRQSEALSQRITEITELSLLDRNVVVVAVLLIAAGLLGLTAYLRVVTRELGGDPAVLKQVVEAVAAGDLTVAIRTRAGDERSTLHSLRLMTQRLETSVAGVRQTAEQVANASAEIASGNHDLSRRTEQQASALEQTAASMEELSSTIGHNSQSSQSASAMVVHATELAQRGQRVMNEVTATMAAIADSSRQINDITATIDSLAFQTNILALNAAVEAARAGEQGRGFAVVAGEVRSLAQRSAHAAKEIRVLIDNSGQRVKLGGELVGRAEANMGEIVQTVKEASALMTKISEASLEQSHGVQQATEAIAHMDQATQQNAALVEEMAAAAQSLQQQAQTLLAEVGVFRIAASSPQQLRLSRP